MFLEVCEKMSVVSHNATNGSKTAETSWWRNRLSPDTFDRYHERGLKTSTQNHWEVTMNSSSNHLQGNGVFSWQGHGRVHRPSSSWTSDADVALLQLSEAGSGGIMGIISGSKEKCRSFPWCLWTKVVQALFSEVRVLRGSWGGAKEGWLGFSDISVVDLKTSHQDWDRADSGMQQFYIWIKQVKSSIFRVKAWLGANWVHMGQFRLQNSSSIRPSLHCSVSNWTRLVHMRLGLN